MTVSQEEFHAQIEEVEWHWLKPHMERGVLILVGKFVDLAEAASRIAADDTPIVSAWIAAGHLGKPSEEEIDAFNTDPVRRFRMLIVQPWILLQEIPSQ